MLFDYVARLKLSNCWPPGRLGIAILAGELHDLLRNYMIALGKLCTILHAEHNHIQYQTSGFINFNLLTVNKQAETVDYIYCNTAVHV